jgi:hypothetical protein
MSASPTLPLAAPRGYRRRTTDQNHPGKDEADQDQFEAEILLLDHRQAAMHYITHINLKKQVHLP